LAGLAEKGVDVDVLHRMAQFMTKRPMEIDDEERCSAGNGDKSAERTNSRNGDRERTWETQAGSYRITKN
jgi:putative transposase